MTRPVSFFRRVTILLELYRENWQGGNINVVSYVDEDCDDENKTDAQTFFPLIEP